MQNDGVAKGSSKGIRRTVERKTTRTDCGCCLEPVRLGSRRINGFQRPWSLHQMGSWIAQTLTAIMHYVVSYLALKHHGRKQLISDGSSAASNFTNTSIKAIMRAPQSVEEGYPWAMIVAMAVYIVLFIPYVSLWIAVENSDASRPGGLGWPCFKETQRKTRYCGLCKKNVTGLDHHCIWLNTCIGKRNYHLFFWLITFGVLVAAWQVAVGLYATIVNKDMFFEGTPVIVAMVFLIVYDLLVFTVLGLIFSTLAFQLYTMYQGIGTYDWIIRKQRLKRERQKAKQEAEEKAAAERRAAEEQSSVELTAQPSCPSRNRSPIDPLAYIHGGTGD